MVAANLRLSKGGLVGSDQYHLAQINIGRIRAALTDPLMADFVANLQPINELAEASPGFVWRFQTEEGDATAIRPYDDDRMIINFSIWENPESLRAFVYQSAHNSVMKRRREWFERLTDVYVALWWVLRDHRPTIEEAVARLEYLKRNGPSAFAFTFRDLLAPPAGSSVESVAGNSGSRANR
jgi:hypothetical protein